MTRILVSKSYLITILLIAILFFHFLNNLLWLRIDNSVLRVCDGGWQMIEAIKFQVLSKRILNSGFSFLMEAQQLLYLFRAWPLTNWPSFIYFLSSLINPNHFSFFRTRLYINFIFYFLLIVSTYFLGKKCFNQRVGLKAAFLVSFYPAIYAFSRQFGLDFPLTSLTALCLCLLVYSENFSKRNYSLLFGLSLGIATLVKLQIMFFILTPLLYSIFKMFSKENKEELKSFANLILSFLFAYFLFSLYWGVKLKATFINFYEHAFFLYPFYKGEIVGANENMKIPIFSLRNITFYLRVLINHSSLCLFVLFTFALIFFLLNKKNKWHNFFFLSLLISYFILTFISVKWSRYALPILIFMAIISAWWLDNLKFKYLRIIISTGLVFYCIRVYLLSSWMVYDYFPIPDQFIQPRISDIGMFDAFYPHSQPPDPHNYIEELKRKGVISHIENKLKNGSIIKIKFGGDSVENPILFLYLYFQDYILNKKIYIQRDQDLDFRDADYVAMRERDLFIKEELLKDYRILSKIGEFVFLTKNEKGSLI